MNGDDPTQLLESVRHRYGQLLDEVHQVIIGQDLVVQNLVSALFARGHCLLIGVPGLAKTLLVKTLSQCLSWDFKRIQFTPDLMPGDILGTEIIDVDQTDGQRKLRFVQGPIFANLILADEINRTPPKTQSALLEAMQEYSVTVAGRTMPISPPFFVVATQNPIEQEGTYPLPEAQLDRFMYALNVGYPSAAEEERIAAVTTTDETYTPRALFSREDMIQIQHLVRQVPVSPHVTKYAVSLVRASRPDAHEATPLIKQYAQWGAGPRASQYLLLGAKALAVMHGKTTPTASDIRQVAPLVLSHRIIRNYAAVADDVTSEGLVADLVQTVREPSYAGV
jgi:MoxR-like ATPase